MSGTRESVCMVCSIDALRGVSMADQAELDRVARELIQGILLGVDRRRLKLAIKDFKPPQRRGVCVVERCARLVEAPCGACRDLNCQRCAIAGDLRASRDRINADRDAELAEMDIDDAQLETLVDHMIAGLCVEHVALGPALVRHWYDRRGLAPPDHAVGATVMRGS